MAFDSNSFVFDAAFNLRTGTLQTIDQTQKTRFGTLSNLYFGFPVTKWWRTSLGVMPYSNVGYDMQGDQVVENLGRMVTTYSGSGGLNKAYIGNAFSPFKNFSVGVNMSYIFGTINKERSVTFPDSGAFYNTMIRTTAQLRKLNFDAGMLYKVVLNEGRYMQFGVTYHPKQLLVGHAELITYSYHYDYSNNVETPKDTLTYLVGDDGEVVLPESFGAGFVFGSTNRWFATADFNWQKWSQFRYLGSDPRLNDNLRVSIGGQFRPSPVDIGKYYERINYRAGFRFEQSYLNVKDTRINDFGVSFGVGLPMKKSRSTINIAVELGTQGTTDNGLIKDKYVRFTIGSALQERWFLQRRFN